MSFTPSAVSAPGKVLLAGGYLVLDKNYSGLVFALSARIYCVSGAAPSGENNVVTVRSPQFKDAEWIYHVSALSDDRGTAVSQTEGAPKNPFVETALRYVLSYLSITALPAMTITIYADNDYYSQPPGPQPRFNNLKVPINTAHKTGLGSSAALVTSLTSCLLSTFPSSAPRTPETIHNLSQAAHCAAQGKVGSGFDVAAAVYGSCLYERFSPEMLTCVPDAGAAGFAGALRAAVDKVWDLKVQKTRVPPGMRVVMGDVDCGSSTPGMVRTVLAWRKERGQEATTRWDTIQELNMGLIGMLQEAGTLATRDQEGYRRAVEAYAKGEVLGDPGKVFRRIAERLEVVRENIRAMGAEAGVEVEPLAQTRLLDAGVAAADGVLGGVVPGAGGYDAVVFLMVDVEETVEKLKGFLEGYKFDGKGKVTALGTREEHEGVRSENLSEFGV